MRVKQEELKRNFYLITDKPYFMNQKAFVSVNVALSNVNIKKTGKEPGQSVWLYPTEVSALILAGITYAKKDTELGQIRDFLSQKTREEGKSAVWYLPKDFAEFLGKLGYDKEVSNEKLLDEALKTLKSYEVTPEEIEELSEEVDVPSLTFLMAVYTLADNPYDEKLINYYLNQIDSYVDYKKKQKGDDLTHDELVEAYKNAYLTTAYRINRKAEVLSEVIKKKTVADAVIPKDFTDKLSHFKARESLFAVVEAIRKAFNPEFDFSMKEIKDVSKRVDKALKDKESAKDNVTSLLNEELKEIMSYPEARAVLGYNLVIAMAGVDTKLKTIKEFLSEAKEKGIETEDGLLQMAVKDSLTKLAEVFRNPDKAIETWKEVWQDFGENLLGIHLEFSSELERDLKKELKAYLKEKGLTKEPTTPKEVVRKDFADVDFG